MAHPGGTMVHWHWEGTMGQCSGTMQRRDGTMQRYNGTLQRYMVRNMVGWGGAIIQVVCTNTILKHDTTNLQFANILHQKATQLRN